MLEVENIETYYGDAQILWGVSLAVHPGEVVALLGRNGVGKTTAIRSIMGFTPPRRGRITYQGRPIHGLPSEQIARMGVGLVPQGRRIFPNLSVRENLTVGARPRTGGRWTLERIHSLFPVLKQRGENAGWQLSGGEQSLLAVGRALMTNPDLILMDEPSEGLAPLVVRNIAGIIRTLKQEGLAILLVEQNLNLALEVADRVLIMSKGCCVYEGTPEQLRSDAAVKSKFLGV